MCEENMEKTAKDANEEMLAVDHFEKISDA